MTKSTVTRIENTFSDLTVVNAARVSFGKQSTTFDPEKDTKLINYLVKHNHWSPLAHPHAHIMIPYEVLAIEDLVTDKSLMAGLTFGYHLDYWHVTGSLWAFIRLAYKICCKKLLDICAEEAPESVRAYIQNHARVDWNYFIPNTHEQRIHRIYEPLFPEHSIHSFRIKAPIFVERQLFKHQVGLVANSISGRYVELGQEIYEPESWRGVAKDKKQGSSEERVYPQDIVQLFGNENTEAWFGYNDIISLSQQWYAANNLLCNEQRRMILPLSTMTEWIWTGTREAFDRVVSLRCQPDSQKETREVVEQLRDLLK